MSGALWTMAAALGIIIGALASGQGSIYAKLSTIEYQLRRIADAQLREAEATESLATEATRHNRWAELNRKDDG